MEGCEREKPRFAVWRRSMNLLKQVEPLKKAALQASSLQRHAHHAASRLTWVKRWLKRAYRHHAQSRELKISLHLTSVRVRGSRFGRSGEHTIEEPFESPCALGQGTG